MKIGDAVIVNTNDNHYVGLVESVSGADEDVLGVVYWPETEPTAHAVDLKPGTENGTWSHP